MASSAGSGSGTAAELDAPPKQQYLTPETLLSLRRVTGLASATKQLAAGSEDVVYSLKTYDGSQATSALYGLHSSRSEVSGEAAVPTCGRKLTSPAAGTQDMDPVISEDGSTVFFLSTRASGRGIWAVPMAGGEPTCIAELPVDISNLTLVPTGAAVAAAVLSSGGKYSVQLLSFSAETYVDSPHTPAASSASLATTGERDAALAAEGSKVTVYDALPVRHWDTWNAYQKHNHVYVLPVAWPAYGGAAGWVAGGYYDTMPGIASDCPGKPFGGMPDGVSFHPHEVGMVALTYRPSTTRDERAAWMWSTATAVHITSFPAHELVRSAVDAALGGEAPRMDLAGPRKLTVAAHVPATSPDSWLGDNVVSGWLNRKRAAVAGAGTAIPIRVSTLATTHCYPTWAASHDMHGAGSASPAAPTTFGIAFLRMARPKYEADALKPTLYAFQGPDADVERPLLTRDVDTSFGSLACVSCTTTGVGRFLATTDVEAAGRLVAFEADVGSREGGAASAIAAGTSLCGTVHQFAVVPGPNAATTRVVAMLSSMRKPVDFHAVDISWPLAVEPEDTAPPLRGILPVLARTPAPAGALTAVNADMLRQLTIPAPESIWYPGAKGEAIHAYLLPPAQMSVSPTSAPTTGGGSCTYPLAVLIHGGPQGNFGDDWHWRWNPQVFAAAGYYTLCINFHGSTSFGQAFTDSINGDWGGAPFEDIIAGVEHVCRSVPRVDSGRVCALGASFGGYMINWLNGNAGLRFKAFVYHCGIFDTRSFYFSTEELWFPE